MIRLQLGINTSSLKEMQLIFLIICRKGRSAKSFGPDQQIFRTLLIETTLPISLWYNELYRFYLSVAALHDFGLSYRWSPVHYFRRNRKTKGIFCKYQVLIILACNYNDQMLILNYICDRFLSLVHSHLEKKMFFSFFLTGWDFDLMS